MAAMPTLTLPDGAAIELPEGEPIGSALPKGTIAARVDGELRDLSFVPAADAAVEAIAPGSEDGLHVLRHSTAHVLAQAVCDLYPGTKYAIGPAVTDGFYYDFDLPETIGTAELAKIDRRMRQIVKQNQPFVREEVSRAEAAERLADQPFKLEIIAGLDNDDDPEASEGETVSLYRNGGLGRPLHGSARAAHRQAGRLQAHQRRRCLLARGREEPPADPHLRHRLGHQGRSRRAPAPPGGSRAARSPQARVGAGSVLVPRRDRVGARGVPSEGRLDPAR